MCFDYWAADNTGMIPQSCRHFGYELEPQWVYDLRYADKLAMILESDWLCGIAAVV